MHDLRSIRAAGQRRRRPLALSTLAGLAALCGVARSAAAAPLPDRVWGTYYGGYSAEIIGTAAVDAEGNVYVAGQTGSGTGIATPGAHQTVLSDGDAFLAKFSPEGSLLWGTYFGGMGYGYDRAAALATGDGRVVMVGRAASSQGIATPGAFQATAADGDDGFAASFTADGVLEWATYIGAGGYDVATGVVLDAQGSAYVVGHAFQEIADLGTPGAHQSTPGGGRDPYIVKFDAQGQRVWGSYYGGAPDSQFEAVAINELGELYVAGRALAPDDALVTPGAHQAALAEFAPDALLVRFTLDGQRVWGTYYGGQGNEDVPRVTALPQGGAVLTGSTRSADGIASAGAYQASLAGVEDAFLARFDAAGTRLWGTYYGGSAKDATGAITSDAAGGVYVCGLTTSPNGIATQNAFSTVISPPQLSTGQLFVARFDDLGERRWGSYFNGIVGGAKLCNGVTVDASYRIHTAGAAAYSELSTPGAHQEVNAGFHDGYILQWDQGLGQPCAGPDDCGSGWCVDGMCCDTACGDGAADCQACSIAAGGAIDGVCTWLGADVTCRAADGACDVAETCPREGGTCPADAHAPDGEPCEDGLCSAGLCMPGDDTTIGGESTTDDASTTGNDSTTGEFDTTANGDTTGEDSTTANGDTTGEGITAGNIDTTGDVGARNGNPGSNADTSNADASALADGAAGCNLAGDPALGLLALPWWLARRRRR